MARADTVLFDMDGVLVDSRVAIARSMRHALDGSGLEAPTDSALHGYIGPPLHDAFGQLLDNLGQPGDDQRLVAALVERYRERYRANCVAETEAFPGIAELLARLAPARRLAVVTSKPSDFAVPILAGRGLAGYFAHIEGPSLAARSEAKRDTLARALAALGSPPVDQVVMIGDRSHDVEAAAAHGIATLGVLWGIGDADELREAGAAQLFATPAELGDYLLTD